MIETRPFHDPRRLFELWKELTGEDLMPYETTVNPRPEKRKEEQRK